MNTNVPDQALDRMIAQLNEGKDVYSAVKDVYGSMVEADGVDAAHQAFGATAVKTVGAFVPVLGAANELIAGLMRDDVEVARRIARYLALKSSLDMLGRDLQHDRVTSGTRLVLQAAIGELERVRSLSEPLRRCDVFAIALLQAFAAARLCDTDAADEFARPVLVYLDETTNMTRTRIRGLEEERDVARRKLDDVRSYFTEEKINSSAARLELGLIKKDDLLAAAQEPINVVMHGQAEVDRIQRDLSESRHLLGVNLAVRAKLGGSFSAA